MAQINIVTSVEEQHKVLQVIRDLNGAVAPVSRIAQLADMKPSRARYAILDLLEAGCIKRNAHKAFNKHYVRYSYTVCEVRK